MDGINRRRITETQYTPASGIRSPALQRSFNLRRRRRSSRRRRRAAAPSRAYSATLANGNRCWTALAASTACLEPWASFRNSPPPCSKWHRCCGCSSAKAGAPPRQLPASPRTAHSEDGEEHAEDHHLIPAPDAPDRERPKNDVDPFCLLPDVLPPHKEGRIPPGCYPSRPYPSFLPACSYSRNGSSITII